VQIEQYHVGLDPRDVLHRLRTIGALGYHPNIFGQIKQGTDALADKVLVVNETNGNHRESSKRK
jgi:hypothetical protein